MTGKYELIIDTDKDIQGKIQYELYKDGVMIAKGKADAQNIYDMFLGIYLPKVIFKKL